MKIQLLTATVGAAILLAGAPAFAAAPTDTTGPIQINNVQAHGGASEDNDGSFNSVPASVSINFKNESSSPATTAIKHTFALNQIGANETVVVAEATLADGTVWRDPAAREQQPAVLEGFQVAARFRPLRDET